jgi:AraC-like DNA-binding protein
LLGVPGEELAERHVSLEDLWGRSTAELRERLLAERLPAARVRVLEESLLRVGRRAPVHPAVEHALARLAGRTPCSIEALALETGYSHKHLIALFRRAVGLTPKIYARIRRFQRVIASASDGRASGWAAVALACDFYDQAHLTRDFQAFAGLAPGAYAPLSAERPNHVPIDEPR